MSEPFADEQEAEAFHALVAEQLKTAHRRGDLSVVGFGHNFVDVTTHSDPETRIRLGLDNLSCLCRRLPREDWHEVVSDHFDAILARFSRSLWSPIDVKTLYLAMLPEDYEYDGISVVQVVPKTLTALCQHDGSVVSYVHGGAIEGEGLDECMLWQRALQNMREMSSRVEVETRTPLSELGGGFSRLSGHVNFLQAPASYRLLTASFALFLPEVLGPSELGYLYMMPSRRCLHVVPVEDPTVVALSSRLRNASLAGYEAYSSNVSPEVYWTTGRITDHVMLRAEGAPEGEVPCPRKLRGLSRRHGH